MSPWTPRNYEINLRVFKQGNKLVGPQGAWYIRRGFPCSLSMWCPHLLSISPWSLPRSFLSESHIFFVYFSSLSLSGHNQQNRPFGWKPLLASEKRESQGLSRQWPLGKSRCSVHIVRFYFRNLYIKEANNGWIKLHTYLLRENRQRRSSSVFLTFLHIPFQNLFWVLISVVQDQLQRLFQCHSYPLAS